MFNMPRGVTKSKSKRGKIKMENDMAAAATTTACTLGHICVLCRQEMLLDTCCCRQAVEAVDSPASSEEAYSSSNSSSCQASSEISAEEVWFLSHDDIVLCRRPKFDEVETTGKKRDVKCSGHQCSNECDDGSTKNNRQQRENFNIFSNCHNILRTLQSLLLLMFNCGIFNKRRRRQHQQQHHHHYQHHQHHHQQHLQRQQANVSYTKFLLLLQTLAAATTRLSLSPKNYKQQQQLQHNQQLPRATPQQKQQEKDRHKCFHYKHNYSYSPGISLLLFILLANTLAIQAVVLPAHQQHLLHNDIADGLDKTALSVSGTQTRWTRSESNPTMRLSQNVKRMYYL